jgi:prevent-host-death family protein
MDTANIHEAKTQLSRLLERVENGEEIIIARAGRPVAKLVPYRAARKPRVGGQWREQVHIRSDFDALPADLAVAFGMTSEPDDAPPA